MKPSTPQYRAPDNGHRTAAGPGLAEKVRVFIGTEPKTEIARKVLETSIRRRTDAEVVFTPMIGPEWEYDHDGIAVGTGFSLRRWMIAAECRFRGRAVYLDADQLVLSDVWQLWKQPDLLPKAGTSIWCCHTNAANGHKLFGNTMTRPNTSVMVIDCAAARDEWGWRVGEVLEHLRARPTGADYQAFMAGQVYDARMALKPWTKQPPVAIDPAWNHLDAYEEGKTKLLHYTRVPDQPWYNPDHPHAMPWRMELQVAINVGAVTQAEVEEAVAEYRPQEPGKPARGLHPDYLPYIGKPGRPSGVKRRKRA